MNLSSKHGLIPPQAHQGYFLLLESFDQLTGFTNVISVYDSKARDFPRV